MEPITRRAWLKALPALGGGLALSTYLTSPACLAQVAEAQSMPTEAEAASMAQIARQFMDDFRVPGLSLAIARHGQFTYREGFGLADKESNERVTPAHLFRIASVSKPITSAALYSLLDQGKLKLDDPVFGPGGHLESEYGGVAGEFEKQITLHQLLTHTTGGWENNRKDPMFLQPALDQHELISWTLQHQPLTAAPGGRYAYSNFGYCVLGRVLEKIAQQPYADFVQQHVLANCEVGGMRLAGNTLADRNAGEVVYYSQDGGNPYGMNVRRMDSHGGWLATASDLVRFATHVDGFNTTPSFLSAAALKAMTTPSAVNTFYASGWSVNKVPNWWHEGSLPGTMSILVRTASGLCWAALANTRAKGMESAIDSLMWKIVKAVPAWKA